MAGAWGRAERACRGGRERAERAAGARGGRSGRPGPGEGAAGGGPDPGKACLRGPSSAGLCCYLTTVVPSRRETLCVTSGSGAKAPVTLVSSVTRGEPGSKTPSGDSNAERECVVWLG